MDPTPQPRPSWRAIILGLVAALAGGLTIGIAVTDNGVDIRVGKPHTVEVQAPPAVIAVDGPDRDAKPDDPVKVTPAAQEYVENLTEHPADLADKPGLPPLKGLGPVGPVAVLEPPFASDTVPGCKTRTLPTNWSARAPGAQVQALALHYTAGPDMPNSRADVDGLTTYGSNPSAAVSWHGNLDKDGNCDINVPYRYKAWTIAGLNSVTVNYEVHGRGEAPYLRPAGYRELARIWVDFHRRYPYIPLRLGATDGNCHVTRTGIITHWMGGPCSGGHVDIKPLAIEAVIAELARYVEAASCSVRCHRSRELRAKHRRTHQRIAKRDCHRHQGAGYCETLRHRNKAVHLAARREHVSLRGTYR